MAGQKMNFLKVFPSGLGPQRLGRSPLMRAWLESEGRNGMLRLIHNHSIWMMPNVYPGWVAKKYKVPYVVSPRGAFSEWAMASGSRIKRIFWPLMQRPSLEAVTCWHATAESEYRDIRRLGFRQPVAVIPNGVDIPEMPEKDESQNHTLLFLGRIHPKKGLDMLLPAWKAIQDRFPSWRLRIVGPDNSGYLIKMHRFASDLGLQRVEFYGPLYGKDKWTAYRNADLFILPSYSENFGMAVAEALASGLPAIVSKGAPWEGLGARNAGRWIDNNIDALIGCLEELMSCNSETLDKMGQRGRMWMEQEYSWDKIGQKMAETYQYLLNGGQLPPWVMED
jgi:glycosyltransferase involved in cell wall biosynthesis